MTLSLWKTVYGGPVLRAFISLTLPAKLMATKNMDRCGEQIVMGSYGGPIMSVKTRLKSQEGGCPFIAEQGGDLSTLDTVR